MFYYVYSKLNGSLVLKTDRMNAAILKCFPATEFAVVLSDPNLDRI